MAGIHSALDPQYKMAGLAHISQPPSAHIKDSQRLRTSRHAQKNKLNCYKDSITYLTDLPTQLMSSLELHCTFDRQFWFKIILKFGMRFKLGSLIFAKELKWSLSTILPLIHYDDNCLLSVMVELLISVAQILWVTGRADVSVGERLWPEQKEAGARSTPSWGACWCRWTGAGTWAPCGREMSWDLHWAGGPLQSSLASSDSSGAKSKAQTNKPPTKKQKNLNIKNSIWRWVIL